MGGCGTMVDLLSGPAPSRYYAGVQNDAAIVEAVGKYFYWGPPKFDGPYDAAQAVSLMALGLADLPFSAVVDTLVLPLAYASHHGWADPPVHVYGSKLGSNFALEPDMQ